jgi:hypothetical protein
LNNPESRTPHLNNPELVKRMGAKTYHKKNGSKNIYLSCLIEEDIPVWHRTCA